MEEYIRFTTQLNRYAAQATTTAYLLEYFFQVHGTPPQFLGCEYTGLKAAVGFYGNTIVVMSSKNAEKCAIMEIPTRYLFMTPSELEDEILLLLGDAINIS